MTSSPDIFLSYSRDDQARAKLFAEAFEREGFRVWWDVGLRAGEAYDTVTETALKTAKAVVVLWSKRSVESRWVRAEATLADRNKTLVPAMIEPCERPIMFELTQTAELMHWKGAVDDRVWVAFMADVKQFIERDRGAGRVAGNAPVSLAQIAAEPDKPSETLLAVLPFDNLSSDADMQFFSDGVSEDILGRIQRGSKLKVISRTSSFQFRGPDKPKAAAALKVTHIVDGSIRRAGGKVRIAAHLTEAATQQTLWSDRYDRGLEDVFAVQDEISEAIAAALDTAFFPKKVTPIDPAAYDLYLRIEWYSTVPEQMLRNLALMESVTRLTQDFADGWARYARIASLVGTNLPYGERGPIKAKAEAALARALVLDPDNLEALCARWALIDPFGAFLEQEAVRRRCCEIAMNAAVNMLYVATTLDGVGRMREAVTFVRRSRDLDPRNQVSNTLYGTCLWRSGRFAEGIAAMEAHAKLWPDDHHVAAALIVAYAHQHDWAKVDVMLEPQRLVRYPLREHSLIIGLIALLRSPDPASRRLVLEMMRGRVEKTGHLDPAAMIWPAVLGFADEAFDILDGAKLGPSGGPDDTLGVNAYRSYMLFSVAYPELRANPRFVKLCARLGLVEYWLETQSWPDCADEVPYDFRAECERYRNHPKDKFFG
jgi:TolB-like protein